MHKVVFYPQLNLQMRNSYEGPTVFTEKERKPVCISSSQQFKPVLSRVTRISVNVRMSYWMVLPER